MSTQSNHSAPPLLRGARILSGAETAAVLAAVEHGRAPDHPDVGAVVTSALQAIAAPPSMPLRAAVADGFFTWRDGALAVSP